MMHTSTARLLLADARLPTGSHTQSAGLEPALLGLPAGPRLRPSDIEAFIETRLRTGGLIDAAAAVLTLRRAPDGADDREILAAWNARTPSHVVREASCLAARGYLRLGVRFGLDAQAPAPCGTSWQHRTDVPRPVAVGLLGVLWGLHAADVARAVLHDDVQTITAAALKLEPLDPITATGWSLDAAELVDDLVARAGAVTCAADIPAPAAPLAELWQHHHPHHPRRLFRA